MPLSPGSHIGAYQVLSLLGRGGMGEVYSARDERLGRVVALKVLPEALAQDVERLRRLEAEARVASALNHPNIVTIHEFACCGTLSFIVMEYVEGKTLRERLSEGPIPMRQVLDLASQVAKGLAAAHAEGIVHRDLKPENIMLARSGFAKILDFGLAASEPSIFQASTLGFESSASSTGRHRRIGTVHYMSPEQAQGDHLDGRSDQFSLGVVLYEMATGRNPFRCPGTSESMLAIIQSQPPPLSEQRPDFPAPFRWAVEQCLSKDPSGRYDSTGDLARDLENVRDHLHELERAKDPKPSQRLRPTVWIWPAVALLGIGLAVGARYFEAPQPVGSELRFTVPPPPGATFNFSSSAPAPLALSPDGRQLVFGARDASGKSLLWLRSFKELAARPLAGTDGATYPFWSPDSRSLGFFADGELRRISASGGPVVKICDTPQGRGGTWNRNGVIVFAPGEGPLLQVAASGGAPVPLAATAGARPLGWPRWPNFLPDGRQLLFLAGPQQSGASFSVRVTSLDSSHVRPLVSEPSNAAYSPPGYLLFVRGGDLVAAPFDHRQLRIAGDPVVIADSVHYHHYRHNADFSVSETGVLAYYGGDSAKRSQLQWFDRHGRALEPVGDRAEYGGLRFSPDGSRCAVEIRNPRTSAINIWLLDLKRGLTTRLTSGAAISDAPVWSPDGQRVLFAANYNGVWDLYWRSWADVGGDELAYSSGSNKIPTDWSPDGRFVAFEDSSDEPTGNVDLWVLSLVDRSTRPLLRTPFRESQARFSPDGRAIAYVSDEAGRQEIHIRSFPATESRVRVSADGGSQPLWSRNGGEIFYVSGDDKLMSVPVVTFPRLEVGEPRALFSLHLAPSASDNPRYAVSPDGQRVLVNTPGTSETPNVVVQVNWTAGLRP